MPNTRSTISKQLEAARIAIANSQADAEIKALVAAYGYDDAKLAEGQQLYDTASAAVSAQTNADGAQKAATENLQAAKEQATKAYQKLAKVARAITKPSEASSLGLDGAMPKASADFLKAAGILFDNAANIPGLSKYGYDAAKLTAERAAIDAYAVASSNKEIAKGAAQQASAAQDAALLALNQWTAQYIKIARVALSDTQLSEKIGVMARNSKTAAQRAAAAKKQTQTPPAASS
ncbi:MAG: hypothetical protein WA821_03275 [Anaerolineales bacterium]